MTPDTFCFSDHLLTSSHGSRSGSAVYRSDIEDLLNQGRCVRRWQLKFVTYGVRLWKALAICDNTMPLSKKCFNTLEEPTS